MEESSQVSSHRLRLLIRSPDGGDEEEDAAVFINRDNCSEVVEG